MNDAGRTTAVTFAALVLLLGALGALAAVTAERSVDGLLGGAAGAVTPRVRAADDALERRDGGAALRAWQDAYTAARASRRWEPMLEVGDAALRLGADPAARDDARARARRAYLLAFTRAHHEGSVDGVLRASEAFAGLSDHETAALCRGVAERMR
jgi:hypothetical protein